MAEMRSPWYSVAWRAVCFLPIVLSLALAWFFIAVSIGPSKSYKYILRDIP